LSRLLLFALFVLWRAVARPYDTSAALNLPCLSANNGTTDADYRPAAKWKALGDAIEEVVMWDSVYYMRIAECGYEYEQTHAFFPALPLLMHFVANTVLNRLVPLVGYRPTLTIAGYLITNVAFVYAAIYLYKLTLYVMENEDQAWRVLCLFCFNPASVFYSSIYSESLFAFCSFGGLWQFLEGRTWRAALLFGLSSGVRSNGVLHAGFFLFQAMHCFYKEVFRQGKLLTGVVAIAKAVVQSVIVFVPLVAFQRYGYLQHCGSAIKEARIASRPWCNSKIPYLYGFVQSHYWNVGFLRYYEVKQIPNFMLAAPTLVLAVGALIAYGRKQPNLLPLLGFNITPSQWWKLALMPQDCASKNHKEVRQIRGSKVEVTTSNKYGANSVNNLGGFYSPAAVCFLVQLAVMVVVATFIMHVQVATRFLSVSPPVYWYAVHLMETSSKGRLIGRIIWTYCLSYIGLGSLLFINFYPFT